MKRIAFFLLSLTCLTARVQAADSPRERLLMDSDWRFALGHVTDETKDFTPPADGFTDRSKTGFGNGARAENFDDSGWRKLDLPHDWAVELPFSEKGSISHGYKAIGGNFPENSIGWYRKKLTLPASDLGKRISIEFGGVFRDSEVWINGHYLGREESGYSSFSRNLTEFLNYGGENVLVVRVDASRQEGWFYEGAGIYRHVWLVKTEPLHVAQNGTFVTSEIKDNAADVTARTTVVNDGDKAATFDIRQDILDGAGKTIATAESKNLGVPAGKRGEFNDVLPVANPKLWSIDTPDLHTLVTTITSGGKVVDRTETTFGIRSIRFDANEGFFLNGKHVKLKGTDNHQDHAGVGAAIPDALQVWRIEQLKKFGCNLYRASHNPPTPELLDACDRLGMVVIDENRLMGTSDFHHDHLRRLIERDRNHPSVILWSIGNEEWKIEGSEAGARIASTMQRWTKQLDPTRPVTLAISGGWGGGFSEVIEVAGLNYLGNLKKGGFTTDQWHARKPDQPILGTEECAFHQTRGIYFDDPAKCHLRAYDWHPPNDWGSDLETAWKHYADRPYLAGICIWTGFDYRGEPTPFGWPAIGSQFGILDLCGFPKDAAFYLKSWWTDEPVLHLFPHWNWQGREGEEIPVWVHSNCDEVELFLNGLSLGKQTVKPLHHLEWKVKYAPGKLVAKGIRKGQPMETARVTTGAPAAIRLSADRTALKADKADLAVVMVEVVDAEGRVVPTAGNKIDFTLTGPAALIGVGNGDPSCHEPDKGNSRSAFNGLAQAIVQTTHEAGTITLQARSPDLRGATLTLGSQ